MAGDGQILVHNALVGDGGQLPAGVQTDLGSLGIGGDEGDEFGGFLGHLAVLVDHIAVGEEVRGFLGVAGLHGDVPVKRAVAGKVREGPDAGDDHAQPAGLEQVPVAHAGHLLGGGHDVGLALHVHQVLQGLHVSGGVHGELGVVVVEQAAAVLAHHLVILVEADGVVIAEDIAAQGADALGGGHGVLPGPVVGGVGDARLVEEILVVDQHHVGEAVGHAVLLAVGLESLERHLVVRAGVDALGLDDAVQRQERALFGVGDKVFVVELKNVGRLAAGDLGGELGKIIVEAIALELDGDVGVLGGVGVDHLLEILQVVARAGKLLKGDGDLFGGGGRRAAGGRGRLGGRAAGG